MSAILRKARVPLLSAAAAGLVFVAAGGAASGDNFVLGRVNMAGKTTALVVNSLPGTTSCSAPCQALKVTDNSTAGNAGGLGVLGRSATTAAATIQNSGGAPALKLFVNPGKTPFTVNSTTKVEKLNADRFDDRDSSAYWMQGGNAPATTGVLGTTTDQPLVLKVNGAGALRLEPAERSPNVIGGDSDNGNPSGSGAFGLAIGGGGETLDSNVATDNLGTVGGGAGNIAGDGDLNPESAAHATVGGGYQNKATRLDSTVAGGVTNQALSKVATVGGGSGNVAAGPLSVIGGGFNNTAQGNFATIGGGELNTTNGDSATIPGGFQNEASSRSFAAGTNAKATQDGSFVWGDFTPNAVTAPAEDTFTVRASGGIWLGTSSSPIDPEGQPTPLFIATSTGASLTDAGVWTDNSDRALKHDFRPLDARTVVEKVARMPITSWSYKVEKPSIRHIGPTAQDFHAAFGLGYDDRHIGTIDEGGVALAAIKGLSEQNRALERRNRALSTGLARLNARVTRLERAVANLRR
jgi:hypothetical protein